MSELKEAAKQIQKFKGRTVEDLFKKEGKSLSFNVKEEEDISDKIKEMIEVSTLGNEMARI